MEDDLLALLDRSDRGTDFLHDPRVFVPQGVRQGDLYLLLPNALHDMEVGMAHSGPRHPDDYVRRILQARSLDIHELERFVVSEKSGRLHALSYRAQSIWALWRSGNMKSIPGLSQVPGRSRSPAIARRCSGPEGMRGSSMRRCQV